MTGTSGLLDFVNARINDDYSGFENAAEEYYNDAKKMKGFVNYFSENINTLVNNISEIELDTQENCSKLHTLNQEIRKYQ
jgi:hypothetical protein